MSDEPDDVWVARQLRGDDGDQEGAAEDTAAGTAKQENTDAGAGSKAKGKPSAAGKHRYDRKVATGLGGVVAVAVVLVLGIAALFYSGGCQSGRPSASRSVAEPAAVAVTKPPAPARAANPSTDRPLPYTADASKSCLLGSTAAQTMAGTDPHNAFVCVRNGLDGEVITIDLDKCYVITAISMTPGWVGKDASGADQWSQHRVVTIAQYVFNHDPATLVTQETKNVHGEAVIPIKHQVAWTISILIRQTSRPPAAPQQQPSAAPGGGLDGIVGRAAPSVAPAPAPDQLFAPPSNDSDPVDATFAISRWTPIGHDVI